MIALREYKKVQNGMVHIKIPDDFDSDEVEVIVIPKENSILKSDPYFNDKRKHVSKTIEDIENGKIKVYSDEGFEQEMDYFEKELISKYDNIYL